VILLPSVFNYAQRFEQTIENKYRQGALSGALGTSPARFINARTIQIPRLDVGGYKEHDRSGGWNRQDITNTWEPKTLVHDRNVQFFVDVMDVDESNLVLSAANVTADFMRDQAIPEVDSYRFSKLYAEYATLYGQTPNTDALDAANVLELFDEFSCLADEAEVPTEGRMLFVTPTLAKLLKSATQVTRSVSGAQATAINRAVTALDNITLHVVPSARMLTAYDFTDGVEPGAGARQIDLILVHPTAVLSPIKHSAIYLLSPEQHSEGDGWVYRNRMYMDLFLLERKVSGVYMHVNEPGPEPGPEPVPE
jgi:hypothetical protein